MDLESFSDDDEQNLVSLNGHFCQSVAKYFVGLIVTHKAAQISTPASSNSEL